MDIGNGEPKEASKGRKMAETKSHWTEMVVRGRNWERLNMERWSGLEREGHSLCRNNYRQKGPENYLELDPERPSECGKDTEEDKGGEW